MIITFFIAILLNYLFASTKLLLEQFTGKNDKKDGFFMNQPKFALNRQWQLDML